MDIGSFLLPTIAGYLLLVRLDYSKPRVLKASGYNVAFLSAAAGVLLFSLAWLLLLFFDPNHTLALDQESVFDPIKTKDAVFLTQTYCLTFILALLGPPVIDYPWRYLAKTVAAVSDPSDLGERIAAESSGDAIGQLLQDAADARKHVQLNLASGKVYVGQPATKLATHGGFDRDAALIPVVSGYRDPNSQELQLDTDYAWVDPQRHGDVRVFVPRREIVMARMFDLEAYELWLLVDEALSQLDDLIVSLSVAESQSDELATSSLEWATSLPLFRDGGVGKHGDYLARPRIVRALEDLQSHAASSENPVGRCRRIRSALEELKGALRSELYEPLDAE